MITLLFLDFDGVLHPQTEGEVVSREEAFCHLPKLEEILRNYPAVRIVISSTWREHFSLTQLRERFSADIRPRIVGTTPVHEYHSARRENEILEWLKENNEGEANWLALDDAIWQFKAHRDNVIACRSYVGLDEEACRILQEKLQAHPSDEAAKLKLQTS